MGSLVFGFWVFGLRRAEIKKVYISLFTLLRFVYVYVYYSYRISMERDSDIRYPKRTTKFELKLSR